MRFRFCFVFAVFYFTAVLVFAVIVRSAENRIFYRLCTVNARQGQMKQQMWQKQLQLESLINPASVSRRLEHLSNCVRSEETGGARAGH